MADDSTAQAFAKLLAVVTELRCDKEFEADFAADRGGPNQK